MADAKLLKRLISALESAAGCGNERKGTSGSGASTRSRPGTDVKGKGKEQLPDWGCSCGFHNFGHRQACRECGQ